MKNDVEFASLEMLDNHSIETFYWTDINVEVKHRETKESITLLSHCNGYAKAGEVLAIMGPSGSGKTTLLNTLSSRSQSHWRGDIMANGKSLTSSDIRSISCYVEQEDMLIGSLTVTETIDFASRLAAPWLSHAASRNITDSLVGSFGLSDQADTIIGTPLRKGISGGQKRRVSVASQLVTAPRVLFLDEPTSGLDSTASREVMSFISTIAKRHRLIVIASIHQPSSTTFSLFDKVLLLAKGETCYFGQVNQITSYFATIAPIPDLTNPAEFLLDLVNDDFTRADSESATQLRPSLQVITKHWKDTCGDFEFPETVSTLSHLSRPNKPSLAVQLRVPLILFQRNWIKSYRDFLAYGTRLVMYIGLAILMGTVWLRLDYGQDSITPFITALFFSGAFMSFMAVAYVPSIIEDLHTMQKEYANGLYGATPFMLANFFVGLPWLALITILFSLVTYWLSNFWDTAQGFWTWVLWLFLDLLAAESLVVLLSVAFPVFVVALAMAAFANGLWMSVGGFLVPLTTLNVFWKYVFHYIDYQAYVFQAMMVNQFKHTIYTCDQNIDGSFYCMYQSDLQPQGLIRGTAVLDRYQYSSETRKQWEWLGIMLGIILAYRLFAWALLIIKLRRGTGQ